MEKELLLKLSRIHIAPYKPLLTVISASVHLRQHLFDQAGELYTEVQLARIRKSRSRYQRGAHMHNYRAWFISVVPVGSGITACSPRVQVQLIALARVSWQFPRVARLALFTCGERKFTGANWCQ